MRMLVAGGTGLVGSELLDQLLTDRLGTDPLEAFEVVHLARREVPATPPITVRVVDFAALDSVEVGAAQVGFCCLGTTIGKAGSREAFLQVDHDAVLAFAGLCKRAGVGTFVLVSSLGADPDSRVFYSNTKGRVERAIAALHFEHFVAVRPSILDGNRSESRPGEAAGLLAMRALAPLMRGRLRRYRPSRAVDVAAAMRVVARAPGRSAVRIVQAEEIFELAAARGGSQP